MTIASVSFAKSNDTNRACHTDKTEIIDISGSSNNNNKNNNENNDPTDANLLCNSQL